MQEDRHAELLDPLVEREQPAVGDRGAGHVGVDAHAAQAELGHGVLEHVERDGDVLHRQDREPVEAPWAGGLLARVGLVEHRGDLDGLTQVRARADVTSGRRARDHGVDAGLGRGRELPVEVHEARGELLGLHRRELVAIPAGDPRGTGMLGPPQVVLAELGGMPVELAVDDAVRGYWRSSGMIRPLSAMSSSSR